jgi:hypothetical protein
VERWDGGSWSLQQIPSQGEGNPLSGVSCPSRRVCVAVGSFFADPTLDSSVPYVERWNGKQWSPQPIPKPPGAQTGGLNGVSCTHSGRRCTAVGFSAAGSGDTVPLAERWNGRRWSLQQIRKPSGAQNSQLESVSCTSAAACTAVGNFGNQQLVERWNGRQWSRQRIRKTAGALSLGHNSVSCASATACTIAGEADFPGRIRARVQRWNGTRWSIQRTPEPAGAPITTRLSGVSCTSTSVCIAVGVYAIASGPAVTLVERWKHGRWAVQNSANST